MTIKDFKVGQTVFIMREDYHKRGKYKITEEEVIKVGRKYVTIGGFWEPRFEETGANRPYLVEHVECGTPGMLFLSRKAIDEY